MLSQNEPIESAIPQEQEIKRIKQLEKVLGSNSQSIKIDNNGEQVLIPESVIVMWRQVVHAMGSGQAISIVPQQQEMTTQEAADFLSVPRPYLIKLLEQGEIPYTQVNSQQRLNLLDLRKYKEETDKQRRKILDELIQESQDLGFYQ
jgi:excisionase family DNA binding protein